VQNIHEFSLWGELQGEQYRCVALSFIWKVCPGLIWVLLYRFFSAPYVMVVGHMGAHLVEALRYKSEGRGFDSR